MHIPVSKAVLPALIAFLFAAALVGIVLNDPFIALHEKWTTWDGAYSHGYLLVGVCAYLLFERVFNTREVKPKPALSILASIPALIWSVGYATQTLVLAQLALPLFLLAVLLPIYGWRVAWTVLPIIGVLFIAVPLWEILLPVLREMTTVVSTAVVRWLGVPAFIDGYAFTLPYGTVLIAGSCAGLSYFLMALALSSLNAIYRGYSFKHALFSIALLAMLAIVGNWVRVIALILIAYTSKMQSSLVADHGTFGWWIFSATFVIFLWLIRKLPEGSQHAHPVVSAPMNIRSIAIAASLTLVFTLAIPIAAKFGIAGGEAEIKPVSDPSFTPIEFKDASDRLQLSYEGYDSAEFFTKESVGYEWIVGRLIYVTQAQGKELISDSQQLTRFKTKTDWLLLENGKRLHIEIHEGRNAQLFTSTYYVGSAQETDPIKGKVRQLTELIQGRSEVALWLASTQCKENDCSDVLFSLENDGSFPKTLLEPLKLY